MTAVPKEFSTFEPTLAQHHTILALERYVGHSVVLPVWSTSSSLAFASGLPFEFVAIANGAPIQTWTPREWRDQANGF